MAPAHRRGSQTHDYDLQMSNAIEVRGLTKSYETRAGTTVHAVRGIDLHVGDGEILAFLGSNGAGKTTTIEILEGFAHARVARSAS